MPKSAEKSEAVHTPADQYHEKLVGIYKLRRQVDKCQKALLDARTLVKTRQEEFDAAMEAFMGTASDIPQGELFSRTAKEDAKS